jgi:hypothetical protein
MVIAEGTGVSARQNRVIHIHRSGAVNIVSGGSLVVYKCGVLD